MCVLRRREREHGCAGDCASRFGAGSLTKSMVATVVARLVQDGRLALDDPVVEHRSGTARQRPGPNAPPSVSLLANRSGLPLRQALEIDLARRGAGDDALSRFAARVAAQAPTTVDWSYTNAGWCLLGRVLETVTGMPWEATMRAVLIAPADMRETAFATETESDARVSGHHVTPDGPVPVRPLVSRELGPAGASVVSTVGDLVRFAALHLRDPTLASLRRPQAAPRIHSWLDGWGLGWACFDWTGGRVWGWDDVPPRRAGVSPARAGAPCRRRAADERRHRSRAVPLAAPRADGSLVRNRSPAAAA